MRDGLWVCRGLARGLPVLVLLLGCVCAPAGEAAALLTTQVPAAVVDGSAPLVAEPDPARTLHVAIVLPMRDLAGLDALVRNIYDPANPAYRHYLSAAQFTERFGPSAADYAAALQFFADNGLRITGTAANRYMIDATASVATLESVLHVKFGLYQHPTENRLFIAPAGEPTVDLNVPLLRVVGLDDFTLPTPRVVHGADVARGAVSLTGSAPGGWYLGSDIRAAYYGGGPLSGAGQSLGLMELGPYDPADIQNYFAEFGPPLSTAVVPISTDGSPATCTGKCNDVEQALDIEYAIAMAPGLRRVQVYVAATADSVLNRMASDNVSAQLSTSWGWKQEAATDDPIFMEMAAQGQTLLTASGDYSTLIKSGPWPEESAYITGVGGTDLRTTGPGGAWAGEIGWLDSAGGPSVDPAITIPTYQLPFIDAANQGSTKLRNVPDIGGDADTLNYICAKSQCSGQWGGTSFASPIWAGFIALANQQAAMRGAPRIGFLNPLVYSLGGRKDYPILFHDAIGGTSGMYTAVKGYDLVTGFGSPHGPALIDALLHLGEPDAP
jgi:kumamolisin